MLRGILQSKSVFRLRKSYDGQVAKGGVYPEHVEGTDATPFVPTAELLGIQAKRDKKSKTRRITGVSRKLSLYILLALTVSMVSQIRAYFIRGSIYKKGSQYIVLLGDWHWVNFLSQKYELIESLKLFNQKQMVTLLEDPDDDDLLKHNKAYISSKQIISSKVDAQNCGPVPTLCSDLKKENVNAIGIENRKIILAFYNELCTTEQLEYIRLESGQLKSGLTIDHMHNEMRNNITAANMFLKKIISDNNKTILQYCKSKLDKITNSYRKFIKELESQI